MNITSIVELLQGMTRAQLRNMATKANVKRGQNRTDTINNLTEAVKNGGISVDFTAHFKTLVPVTCPLCSGTGKNAKKKGEPCPFCSGNKILDQRDQVIGMARFSVRMGLPKPGPVDALLPVDKEAVAV